MIPTCTAYDRSKVAPAFSRAEVEELGYKFLWIIHVCDSPVPPQYAQVLASS